jgi:hypothetical protein
MVKEVFSSFLGGGGWILLGCLQFLFSLVQDDAEMHHKTDSFSS